MVPGNVELIAYEQRKDLLREAEQRRLIKAFQLQQPEASGDFRRKIAGWIGVQMVNWGLKLQEHSSAVISSGNH